MAFAPEQRRGLTWVVAGLAVFAVLAALGAYLWTMLGDVELSTNGYIALVLGTLATVGLGAGLMALVFFSNRRGYDDQAGGGEGK